jgi:glycosyltransferase involved in cell wall biosynthesis
LIKVLIKLLPGTKNTLNQINYMQNITVIVPYHDESHSITNTFISLINQTIIPDEIIFVNSSSNDNSEEIINDLINSTNTTINIRNISQQTKYPSDSINLGIRLSRNELLALIDCGLLFDNNWLEIQLKFMQLNAAEVVLGVVQCKGEGIFDTSCICQTYGYLRKRVCLPGSLIKKQIFTKIGFFEKRRSGYDVQWRVLLKTKGINFCINDESIVKYDGVNYARTPYEALTKSINYTAAASNLDYYKTPKYIITIFIISVISLTYFYKYFYLYIVFYALTRVAIPLLKSENTNFLQDHKFILLNFLYAGFFLDLGKLTGSIYGLVKYNKFMKYFKNVD